MVLTIGPRLFAGGAFFMLEEDVLVTDRGAEVLSAPAPAQLPAGAAAHGPDDRMLVPLGLNVVSVRGSIPSYRLVLST